MRGPTLGGLSLKGRALRLLAIREHSRSELAQKLSAHASTPEALSAVLDELEAKGFVSEQRVAESLVNRRGGKFGTARIRQELQAKGLSSDVVGAAVDAMWASELSRASDVWRKKFRARPQDAAERAKQMRFLMMRGFSPEVVRQVVQTERDDLA